MAIIKFLVLFMLMTSAAFSSAISQAFKRKDFHRVSEIYRAHPNKNFSRNELIYISYSLRKLGFFRQDIKMNIRLVKKEYLKHHLTLLKAIKRGDTIDGDDYPKTLKILYWNLFSAYGAIIKGYPNKSILSQKDKKHFVTFAKILSDLEFRERKVDKMTDEINAHLQYLEDKIYQFKASWYLQYVSWQQDSSLVGPGDITKLIITNRGLCLGGEAGLQNYLFHFYLDGCVLYGAGSVKNTDNVNINYQQSNVGAYGIKAGPGASVIVSSSKSRLGIKIPMIFSSQQLTEPTNAQYSIEKSDSISFVPSLYSRWQFDRWYLQSEFGKYLQKENVFWGLGFGREF
jgi:hypothetical protein